MEKKRSLNTVASDGSSYPLPEGIVPGWYAVAFSAELAPGQVREATVAGIKMVLFRTESGRAVILHRYCPHLGGDLTVGKVKKEAVACPFHGWEYDRYGACIEAPMCKRIPARAQVKSYPVHEGMECIFVYIGGERPYLSLPTDEELFGTEFYVERRWHVGAMRTQPINITRNVADVAHFHGVHNQAFMGQAADFPVTGLDTPVLNSEGILKFPLNVFGKELGELKVWGRARLYGPGIWLSWVKGGLFPWRCFTNFMVTPVDEGRTVVRQVCGVCKSGKRPDVRAFGKFHTRQAANGVHEDAVVWDSIVMPERPVFGSIDEQVVRYDRWYATLPSFARAADEQGQVWTGPMDHEPPV